MEDHQQRTGSWPLAGRFVVAFGVLVILPVVVVSLIFERQLAGTVGEKVRSQSGDIVEQTAQVIDQELRAVRIRSAAIANDQPLLEAASAYSTSSDSIAVYRAVQELDALLGRYFRSSGTLGAVYVIPADGRRFYAYQNTPSSTYLEQVPEHRYAAATKRPGELVLLDDLMGVGERGDDQPRVTLAIAPSAGVSAPGVRAFVFVAKIDPLSRLLSDRRQTLQDGTILLSRPDGTVIGRHETPAVPISGAEIPTALYHSDSRVHELNIGGRPLVATSVSLARGAWRLVYLQDARAIRRLVRRERLPLYLSVALISLGFVAYTGFFFKSIVQPLHALSATMGEVEQGRFDVSVGTGGPRELAALSHAFNTMVQRLSELTAEIAQTERARAEIEVEALQYQINPHFVSNTLNSIRLMAHGSGNASIGRVTGSLMRIVRDSLRTDERDVVLERELENLEDYAFIMKVRFGETFVMKTDIPDEHKDIRILKMLIQPIVENAIVHGVQKSGYGGEVTIRTRSMSDAFLIQVTDNGAGMDDEAVRRATDPATTGQPGHVAIGLHNVHRRMVLHYGPTYGLGIDSRLGEGTTVTMRLPPETANG